MLAGLGALSFVTAFWPCEYCFRVSGASRSTNRMRDRCTRSWCRAPGVSRCFRRRGCARFRRRGAVAALRARAALGAISFIDDLHRLPPLARLAAHLGAAGLLVWYVLSPMHPVEVVVLIARDRLVRQPLQLHGRLRRPGRRHGGDRFRRLRLAAQLGGDGALAASAARSPRRRAPSCPQFPSGAHLSWATSARCRSAFSPARSASSAGATALWPLWFPVLVFAPFVCDATLTLVEAPGAPRAGLAGAPGALLPAPGAHGARPSRHGAGSNTRRWRAAPRSRCWRATRRRRCRRRRSRGGAAARARSAVWIDLRWARARGARMRRACGRARLLAFAHDVRRGGRRVAGGVLAALQPRDAPNYFANAMLDAAVGRAVHALCSGRSACTAACGATRACRTCSASCSRWRPRALAVPALVALLAQRRCAVPRSVLPRSAAAGDRRMSGSRLAYRAWKERRLLGMLRKPRPPR